MAADCSCSRLPEADRSILEHEQLDLFAEAELPEQEQEQESEE